ncbi:MAG: hypothetical protein ACUVRX_02470 [Actinomycetota bacterium]
MAITSTNAPSFSAVTVFTFMDRRPLPGDAESIRCQSLSHRDPGIFTVYRQVPCTR